MRKGFGLGKPEGGGTDQETDKKTVEKNYRQKKKDQENIARGKMNGGSEGQEGNK
jgi:hypothetical protein